MLHTRRNSRRADGLVDAGKNKRRRRLKLHTRASALAAHLKAPLVALQCEYSLLNLAMLRDGNLDLCMETGLVPLAWSPLGGGADDQHRFTARFI